MQENNSELSDIVLNKGSGVNNNKKIILAVATLGVVLIVVILLMNTLSSNDTQNNLPKAVLPPQPKEQVSDITKEEPLFEDVEVVQEDDAQNDELDKIAQKLKEQSKEEKQENITKVSKPKQQPKAEVKKVAISKPKTVKNTTHKVEKTVSTKMYYVQVGSFVKYKPNKKFLKSITDKGFKYKFHKVVKNNKTLNKVLIGPFNNEQNARNALRVIRSSIEPGAFLVRI